MGEWNEKELEEIMKKIENSAEELKIPESLEPENVRKRLSENNRKERFYMKKVARAAVAAVVVVVTCGIGIYGKIGQGDDSHNKDVSGLAENSVVMEDDISIEDNIEIPKKKQVGDYRLAKNYDEICNVVSKQIADYKREKQKERFDLYTQGIVNGGIAGNIKEEAKYEMNYDAEMASPAEDMAESGTGAAMEEDYSTTNLQVEGVDESDFVKNDGDYLYLQSDDTVSIVDIRQDQMKNVAEVKPEMGASDRICDIYLDDNHLMLILQTSKSELKKKSEDDADMESEDYITRYETSYGESSTELQTYDISDKNNVKLLGTVKQDGAYYNSRKVGDYVYLFSEKGTGVDFRQTADDRVEEKDFVPYINGKIAEYDCIYMQDDFDWELITSSVNINEPEKTVDQMVLLDNHAQVYMSTDAIYLYRAEYEWSRESGDEVYTTDIAKFSYKNGKMNGVAAESVRGSIEDEFAISEANGILRVLTTEWSYNSENRLYLLDENLKVEGLLDNIATGEEIYAARYIGNIAYFITYHNTDPLFAVDISNPKKPKMLGKVEISGFSDYLHPYGDNLLLGIGYETDPETSERLGVKLVMFDISNPTKLKIKDSVVIEGYNGCNAASDYKCALVNKEKNLIGFGIKQYYYESEKATRYNLYSWNGKNFVKKFSKNMGGMDIDEMMLRGLYAGNRFYIVYEEEGSLKIRSYDMENDFEKIDKLVIE